jgi:hypothetical protein
MAARRLYTQDTPMMREALALVSRASGLPRSASDSRRIQALAEFLLARVHQEEMQAAKLAAYDAMAADRERSERIRRNARARAANGLL